MQPDTDSESAGAEMHRSIMIAFCDVLRTTQLPPMTVMSVATEMTSIDLFMGIALPRTRDREDGRETGDFAEGSAMQTEPAAER